MNRFRLIFHHMTFGAVITFTYANNYNNVGCETRRIWKYLEYIVVTYFRFTLSYAEYSNIILRKVNFLFRLGISFTFGKQKKIWYPIFRSNEYLTFNR